MQTIEILLYHCLGILEPNLRGVKSTFLKFQGKGLLIFMKFDFFFNCGK